MGEAVARCFLDELIETLEFLLVHEPESLHLSPMHLAELADGQVLFDAIWLNLFRQVAGREPQAAHSRSDYVFEEPQRHPYTLEEGLAVNAERLQWLSGLPAEPEWPWLAQVVAIECGNMIRRLERQGRLSVDREGSCASLHDVEALEAELGIKLSNVFRHVQLEVPGVRLPATVSMFYGPIGPASIVYIDSENATLAGLVDSNHMTPRWAQQLVVCAVTDDDKVVLCLDLAFAPGFPPVIAVHRGGGGFHVELVASYFGRYLGQELVGADGGYVTSIDDTSSTLAMWQDHRDKMLGLPG